MKSEFEPVNPWLEPTATLSVRNLPHFEAAGATYFVTFRCRQGLTLPPQARDILMAAITGCAQSRIDLDAAVVMPDHAHLLFRIMRSSRLRTVMRHIKGSSAIKINRLLDRTGPFWIRESFDHVVRDEAEWRDKIDYIRGNPVKRGLVIGLTHYPWLFLKKATG